jgi:tRNA 2-thiouridine synthesizing protein C
MKSLLLICRHAPWSGLVAREALDIALAGGAFDLPVSLLWQDQGVFQLQAGQQPALLQQKNLQAQLGSLPLFGIEQLYVCRHSLEMRNLSPEQLAIDAQPVTSGEVRQLIAEHTHVMVF